jgi:hypothetical protein
MAAPGKKKATYTVEAFEPDPKWGKASLYKIIDGEGNEVARSNSKEVAEQYCQRMNGK